MANRDEFSPSTVQFLRDQVGNHCSLCDRPTIGPSKEPGKRTNVGTAAHITAAAPGGPRFDPTLTDEQRSSPHNGIWCCRDCGKLVDDDIITYSTVYLRQYKAKAISRAHRRVTTGLMEVPRGRSKTLPLEDLCKDWEEELGDMEHLIGRAFKNAMIAGDLAGWETPYFKTRRRDLTRHFGQRKWWVSTTILYKQWTEARRGFPTLGSIGKRSPSAFDMMRAAETLKSARKLIAQIRLYLAFELELASVTGRDRRDAIRICMEGVKSSSDAYHDLANSLEISLDSVAYRLAATAWNVSAHVQLQERSMAAAERLRSGWLPTAEDMMLGSEEVEDPES